MRQSAMAPITDELTRYATDVAIFWAQIWGCRLGVNAYPQGAQGIGKKWPALQQPEQE
jgi:hypothetical protein